MDYAVVVTDHSGVQLNLLPPRNLKLTRRISTFCDGSMDIEHTRNLAGIIHSNGIKIYRGGVLRFFGQITGIGRKKHVTSIQFADPFWWLQKRMRDTPRTWAVATKGTTIVSNLLTDENTATETHLSMGAVAASSLYQSYSVSVGQEIMGIVDDLAAVAGGYGFFFRVDPTVSGGAKFASLETLVSSGSSKLGARFEYGPGTLGNVGDDWQETEGLPITKVRVWGNPPSGGSSQPNGTAAGGTGTYGLIREDKHFDVPNPSSALLQQVATGYLLSTPPTTWDLKPVPNAGADGLWVPDPWDDFDAGDTVQQTILDDNYTSSAQSVRVREFTVAVDDDSTAERLDSLKTELIVSGRTRRVPTASGRFEGILRDHDRRLARVEHT